MQYDGRSHFFKAEKSPEERWRGWRKHRHTPQSAMPTCCKSSCALTREVLPNLDDALSAGRLVVQYAPKNPDGRTLGLIHEKRGEHAEVEHAMRRRWV